MTYSEITEISKRGMDFHQWEAFKTEQLERNEMNEEAIAEVFGLDDSQQNSKSSNAEDQTDKKQSTERPQKEKHSLDTTTDSFNTCTSAQEDSEEKEASVEIGSLNSTKDEQSLEQAQNVSGVSSLLDDTWEQQERMLALAEKLERGEDIPELEIYRHASGAVEYVSR